MSLRKIRRRLSHTFRFTVDGSLSELAEHLTIDEDGNRQYLTISDGRVEPPENGMHAMSTKNVKNWLELRYSQHLDLRLLDCNYITNYIFR